MCDMCFKFSSAHIDGEHAWMRTYDVNIAPLGCRVGQMVYESALAEHVFVKDCDPDEVRFRDADWPPEVIQKIYSDFRNRL